MAKQLKKIFDPSVDEVQQTFTINAWHVSQSVDALTGADDYDLTISGSLTVTGSTFHNGIQNANGVASSVLVRDNTSGEYYITGAYSSGGSTDYIYSASFNTSSNQIDFYGSGSAFSGTLDLNSLSDTDYISNITWDSSNSDLLFTGVGDAFNGTASLSSLDDNGGGFTLNYSGSVVLNASWAGGSPQTVASTDATNITSSGYNKWHFSDVGRGLGAGNQQQYDNQSNDSLFRRITGSVTDSDQLLVRIYDDKQPEYNAYFINSGSATLGNGGGSGEDLILDLKFIGGRGFGATSAAFPNGTTPNNTNVSFMFLGSGGGGGTTSPGGSDTQVQFNDGGAFGGDANFTWDKTSNYLTIKGNASAPALKLTNDASSIGANTEFAELVAHTSVYSADIASIIFKGDGAFGGGDYPSRIEFHTTNDGSSTPTNKFTIKNNGRVGVGVTNPTSGFFQVNGDVSGTSIYASANIVAYSDARSKTNVETIEGALDKISAIRGVTYNKVEDPNGIRYMGVIAQELQDVLPEVVAEGEDGNLAVAYGNITGVLIEAIKELKAEIEELKANK